MLSFQFFFLNRLYLKPFILLRGILAACLSRFLCAVESNLGLLSFSFISLSDFSREIVPLPQPIKCKFKTNRYSVTASCFSALRAVCLLLLRVLTGPLWCFSFCGMALWFVWCHDIFYQKCSPSSQPHFQGPLSSSKEKVLSRGKKREGPGYKVILLLCVFTVWFWTAHKVIKKRHYLPLSETWIIITEGQKLISHLKIEIS